MASTFHIAVEPTLRNFWPTHSPTRPHCINYRILGEHLKGDGRREQENLWLSSERGWAWAWGCGCGWGCGCPFNSTSVSAAPLRVPVVKCLHVSLWAPTCADWEFLAHLSTALTHSQCRKDKWRTTLRSDGEKESNLSSDILFLKHLDKSKYLKLFTKNMENMEYMSLGITFSYEIQFIVIYAY